MQQTTAQLWATQDRHRGDRWRLFRAVAQAAPATMVLYPGSYVDIAPSFVFPVVTYIDSDRRAARFFADAAGVGEIVATHAGSPREPRITFIQGDYTEDHGIAAESFDLLVSLYAGPISEHCTKYLRIGGKLLVNPSHGDAALASLDSRYELAAAVTSQSGNYRVTTTALDTYLKPKSGRRPTIAGIRRTGRGIAYTKPAFAYLFSRER